MSKRRRGSSHTYYKVPSLQVLALEAVRKRGSKTYSHSHSNLRESIFKMADSDMGESRTSGTQTSSAKEGAKQVGQGLQVIVPRNIPHAYNNNFTVRLTYADSYNYTINGAAGTYARTWSMNSIFDPDVTNVGHQPMMRDLYASQYDYYAVLACHYRIELYNGSVDPITFTSAGASGQRVGGVVATIIPTTNATDITNLTYGSVSPAVEMKNTQSQAIWPEHVVVFEGTLTPGDFIVDAKDADADNTWTANGSNPAVQRYLGLGLNSINSTAFVGQSEQSYSNIQVFVKLDYDVQFTQINQTLRGYPS